MKWFALALVACGGTSSTGTVDGRKFNGSVAWGHVTQDASHIVIEESVNVCQNKSLASGHRNTVTFDISLWNGKNIVPATQAGTYVIEQTICRNDAGQVLSACGSLDAKPVPEGARYAVATYTYDADVPAAQALAGYVHLSSMTASDTGSAAGDYELFLDTGDRLSGTFSAQLCGL